MSTSLARHEEAYSVDRSLCQVESFYVDLLSEGRIFVSQWFDGQRQLADFVMVQQVKLDSSDAEEAWGEVVRVDCCHGEVHIHYFNAAGNEIDRRVLKTLATRADVDTGLELAEDQLYERWVDNVRRWERGH